jgi:hypothetical protein
VGLKISGRVLIPLAGELVPTIGLAKEKQDLKSSDKEVRKQRNDLAKADTNLIKMLKPASNIQSALQYPGTSIPLIAQAITPGFSFMSFLLSVITLGVIGFMKRNFKKYTLASQIRKPHLPKASASWSKLDEGTPRAQIAASNAMVRPRIKLKGHRGLGVSHFQ